MNSLKLLFAAFGFLVCGTLTHASTYQDSLGIKEENGKKYIIHRVDKGETLFAISQRYEVTVKQIRETNPQTKKNLVVGEVILVPYEEPSEGKWQMHTVKDNETLFSISRQYDTEVEQLKEWNDLKNNNIEIGQKLKVGKKQGKDKDSHQETDKTEQVQVKKDEGRVDTSTKKKKPSEYEQKYNNVENKSKVTKNGKLITKKQEGKATWLDDSNITTRKSLALHRSAPKGTIIKVTNLMNDKVVYVKTVGHLNKNEYENTLITISKKAAEKLDVRDGYFRARLEYTIREKEN